jgi:hypothetical protein
MTDEKQIITDNAKKFVLTQQCVADSMTRAISVEAVDLWLLSPDSIREKIVFAKIDDEQEHISKIVEEAVRCNWEFEMEKRALQAKRANGNPEKSKWDELSEYDKFLMKRRAMGENAIDRYTQFRTIFFMGKIKATQDVAGLSKEFIKNRKDNGFKEREKP